MGNLSYSLKALGILDPEKAGVKRWEVFPTEKTFVFPEKTPMETLKAALDTPVGLGKDVFLGLHEFFVENAKPGVVCIPLLEGEKPFGGLMAWLPTKQLVLSWDENSDPSVLLDGEAYAEINQKKFYFQDASVVSTESPHLFVVCEVAECTSK